MCQGIARITALGLALGLMAAAPSVLAQKMYRCSDGKGGTIFQQAPCPETAQEAEARQKEKERLEAEAKARREAEARRKEEAIRKAKERDLAYEQQEKERAEERRKIEEAERRLMEGTQAGRGPAAAAAGPSEDGGLPDHVAQTYPGPWREDRNSVIASAFSARQVQGCDKFRYRQRAGGGMGEYLVNCRPTPASKVHYFVWPKSGAVKGPTKF